MLRLSMACVGKEELAALEPVFFETVNFGLGVHVQEFEKKIQEFLHTDAEVVCVNTGTAAVHLALEACQFPKGSEVIIPSITFLASFSATSLAGLKPVPCDVVFPTCHLDCEDLEKRITDKTVAIMPVAYAGCDFDRKRLYEIARRHKLKVIEDDAHAFGSLNQDGVLFGASGDVCCFSFDGIKNITCGEGGAIITHDKALAHRLRVMRSLGIEKDVELRYKGTRAWDYDVQVQGFRYHMSNINAAIGTAELKKSGGFKEKKAALRREYHRQMDLQQVPLVPTQKEDMSSVLHIFSCILPKGAQRETVRGALAKAGFESGIHYAPNHLHSLYASDYALPVSEDLGSRLISLPYHPQVPLTAVSEIIRVVGLSLS